ncbi:uncharacterized protein EV422DRAFT_554064, partial [Fimicolochytrium jonesii]|uniref:uncharacterized protein n=1 Tax=Fimicolochytrium jonesii TaxID=1396493 RepID=UPI0022FEEF78
MNTINNHVPAVSKVGRATIHSPMPDNLTADIVKATSILEHFIKGTNQMDAAMIPSKVIANAKGIAVITILKAGFLWSGRAGSGIVVAKLPDGRWSAPSAIAAGGAGFGAQIGAQLTDCVFILNNEAAVKAFSHGGNLTFGGNMSVAAGPKGRSAEAAGSVVNLAPIFSYSKSKGLFAGVSLEGSVIVTRSDANRACYGRKVSPKEILSGEVARPVEAEGLYRVLDYKFGNMGSGVVVNQPYTDRMNAKRAASAPVLKKGGVGNKVGASVGSLKRPPGPPTTALSPAAAAGSISTPGLSPSGSISKRPPPPPPKPAGTAGAKTATALFDFLGERPTDLSFRKGDRIEIVKSGGEGDWWVGRLGGREGDFPGKF